VTLANRRPDATVIASYALALDGLGNPLQSTHEQPLFPNLPNQTNSYTYDSDNRLISIDGESVIHDGNGNLRSIGTNSFGYDFENRLIEFTLTHNAGAYLYDGLGNRLSASVNATVRRFVLDRMASLTQVLLETDVNNSPDAYYLYGIGLAQRITPAGETATYHFDIRGSTVAITDSQGIVTDSYAFDSFGVIVNSEGDSTQPFRYLGRYGIIDDSTGVYYARARYFNPQLGRFLTKDPVTGKESDSQSLNRFVYALNNPLAFADVTGLCPGLPYCGYDTANDEVRPPGFWGNLLFDTLITAGVGVFEDIAANALKLALRPFLRRAASTVAEDVPRIVLNKTAGEAAEQIVAKQLQVEGNTILGSHVGVRTSEGLRYIDHLIQTPNGSIVAVEVKSGGAVRSLEQIVKDFALGKQGGVFTGSGGVPEHLISDLSGRPIPTIVITVP
jgi:RHS repeat-associated protein